MGIAGEIAPFPSQNQVPLLLWPQDPAFWSPWPVWTQGWEPSRALIPPRCVGLCAHRWSVLRRGLQRSENQVLSPGGAGGGEGEEIKHAHTRKISQHTPAECLPRVGAERQSWGTALGPRSEVETGESEETMGEISWGAGLCAEPLGVGSARHPAARPLPPEAWGCTPSSPPVDDHPPVLPGRRAERALCFWGLVPRNGSPSPGRTPAHSW